MSRTVTVIVAALLPVDAVIVVGAASTVEREELIPDTTTLKVLLTPAVRGTEVAVRVYPVPALSTLKPLNVATPEDADTVAVPRKAAPDFPVPGVIATVTAPLKPVAVLAAASRAVTTTPKVVPAAMLGGSVVKASWLAAPALTVIVPDVAPVSDVALKLRVRAPIVPVIARFVKVATPLAFVVAVSVPPSVPPPVAMAAVTTVPLWLTALPDASWSWITGCCAKATPLCAVVEGWVVITS